MRKISHGIFFSLLVIALFGATTGANSEEAGRTEEGTAPVQPATTANGGELLRQGMKVEFTVEPAGDSPKVREAEYATVRFRITDASRGTPVSAMMPSVWIDFDRDVTDGKSSPAMTCRDKITLYLQGKLGFRPDIDLNAYYILVMNNDNSLSVIDPILGMTGITKLYAMVLLKYPGADWVMGKSDKRLFVTMPKGGEVAVVDLENFKVATNLAVGEKPGRIAVQPDGRYVWVGNDASPQEGSGVTVIDTSGLKVAARIPTGLGHHEIAFSDDSLFAYVTNRDDGTLSVIDTQTLKKVRDLKVGARPAAVAFSSLSKKAYVANEGDGVISAVDGSRHEITNRLTTRPGLRVLRFAPGDRWGFVANTADNRVYVLDVSSDSIAYSVEVDREPDQFAFTDNFAYIRSRGSAELSLVQLSTLGKLDKLALVKVQAGSVPPGETAVSAMADAITPTPEQGAVLIGNPADKLIYYYMEGMASAMGSFNTYGRLPKGVLALARQLRETAPGVYSARIRIPRSGSYNVAFLLSNPQIVHCFSFAAEPNPVLAKKGARVPVHLDFVTSERTLRVGENLTFRFKLSDQYKEKPLTGLKDVRVIAGSATGTWQDRYLAKSIGDGVYEISVTVPKPGIYQLFFAVPSLSANFNDLPFLFLTASEGKMAQ